MPTRFDSDEASAWSLYRPKKAADQPRERRGQVAAATGMTGAAHDGSRRPRISRSEIEISERRWRGAGLEPEPTLVDRASLSRSSRPDFTLRHAITARPLSAVRAAAEIAHNWHRDSRSVTAVSFVPLIRLMA